MSKIHGYNSYGSIAMIRDKKYYDFTFNVDIMTRDRGSFGLIFSMTDPFNFTAYEINLNDGYKRIVQVKNGHFRTIAEIYDGGLSQNTWQKVQIKTVRNRIKVKTGDASLKYNQLPITFYIDNVDLQKGQ